MNGTMKRSLIAAAVGTALAGGAAQADDYNGFYAGFTLGEGTLSGSSSNYYGEIAGAETGAVYGLYFGRNWQSGAAVMGLEVEYSAGSLEQTIEDSYGGYYYEQAKWDWWGAIRGRAGLDVDGTLLYVTGGLSWVAAKYQYCYYANCTTPTTSDASSDSTEMGLTYGFGAEWSLENGMFDGMSVRAEYFKVTHDTVDALNGYGDPWNFDSSLEGLRFGITKNF